MKIVRFITKGGKGPFYGVYKNGKVELFEASPFTTDLFKRADKVYSEDEIRFLAPCVPTKVVAIGLNYKDHAEELGMPLPEEPLIFLKPPSSVIGPMEEIICPKMSNQVEYEAELAVIIGKRAKDVSEKEASNYILGYSCLNDVTARDLQKKDVQFTRSKSFDTFCPIGPFIETDIDPSSLRIRSFVNDQPKQDSNTSFLIHNVFKLVSFVSQIMTLEPGDVIATGTPFGVGQIRPGDSVKVEIQGIGELINPVK